MQVLALMEIKTGDEGQKPDPQGGPDEGSNSLRWWRRSNRVRTGAEVSISVTLLETEEPPLYQQIAENASRLNQLGMNMEAIARQLKVDGKTAVKALKWISEE